MLTISQADDAHGRLVDLIARHVAYRPARKQGKLSKEGSGKSFLRSASRTTRRYFDLDEEFLCYYQNTKAAKYVPTDTIELDAIRLVCEAPDRAAAHGAQHCFGVVTEKRTYYLLAESAEVRRILTQSFLVQTFREFWARNLADLWRIVCGWAGWFGAGA